MAEAQGTASGRKTRGPGLPRRGCAWRPEQHLRRRGARRGSPGPQQHLVLCRCDLGYSGDDGGPCAACEAGTYKGAVGDAACASCPPHSHSAAATRALASCVRNAGYSGPDGGLCEACAPGKYKEVSGSALCTDCPEHADSTAGSAARSSCRCNPATAARTARNARRARPAPSRRRRALRRALRAAPASTSPRPGRPPLLSVVAQHRTD